MPAFKLGRDKLVQPIQNYSYDQAYLEQVKGVVFIRAKTSEGVSSGSGSIISKDGIILTCNHVVSESSDIQVRLSTEAIRKISMPKDEAGFYLLILRQHNNINIFIYCE